MKYALEWTDIRSHEKKYWSKKRSNWISDKEHYSLKECKVLIIYYHWQGLVHIVT